MIKNLLICLIFTFSSKVLCTDLDLLILHNNDMHARFEETAADSRTCRESDKNQTCYGGFARTAHVIRKYRNLAEAKKGPEVLYLNAGDTSTGTVWYSVHKWKICAEFLNLLKPDAMSFGNHEFDSGVAGLAPLVDAVNFPIVAANLDFTKEPKLNKVAKSAVLEVAGRKIGVIGYLTRETTLISQTERVIFNDEVESIRNESERLNKEGVKIIIALGHSGYEIDQKIAAEVPLVDVVIGGHTNTFLWTGKQPDTEIPEDLYPKIVTQESGKKVPVVQAYAYTKYMGRLNTTFDENGDLVKFAGLPLLLDASIPQDEDILNVLEKYHKDILVINHEVVGKSRVLLDGNVQKCRFEECNFGNLVADALVYYVASTYSGKFWTKAPIGFYNGGGIRNTINPMISNYTITRGELIGAIPFGSQIITLNLTGADLIKTLEIGMRSNGETSHGEFLQVSGLKVVYDKSKPFLSRVMSVKARCGDCAIPHYFPVDAKKIYTVVTTSFLSKGGDGHYVLKENAQKYKTVENLNDIDAIIWYISRTSPIYPEVQGRIGFVDESNVGNIIRASPIHSGVQGRTNFADESKEGNSTVRIQGRKFLGLINNFLYI